MAFDQILQVLLPPHLFHLPRLLLKFVTALAGKMNLEQLLNLATALYLSFDMTTDEEVKKSVFSEITTSKK